jgi:hypothetical protein
VASIVEKVKDLIMSAVMNLGKSDDAKWMNIFIQMCESNTFDALRYSIKNVVMAAKGQELKKTVDIHGKSLHQSASDVKPVAYLNKEHHHKPMKPEPWLQQMREGGSSKQLTWATPSINIKKSASLPTAVAPPPPAVVSSSPDPVFVSSSSAASGAVAVTSSDESPSSQIETTQRPVASSSGSDQNTDDDDGGDEESDSTRNIKTTKTVQPKSKKAKKKSEKEEKTDVTVLNMQEVDEDRYASNDSCSICSVVSKEQVAEVSGSDDNVNQISTKESKSKQKKAIVKHSVKKVAQTKKQKKTKSSLSSQASSLAPSHSGGVDGLMMLIEQIEQQEKLKVNNQQTGGGTCRSSTITSTCSLDSNGTTTSEGSFDSQNHQGGCGGVVSTSVAASLISLAVNSRKGDKNAEELEGNESPGSSNNKKEKKRKTNVRDDEDNSKQGKLAHDAGNKATIITPTIIQSRFDNVSFV